MKGFVPVTKQALLGLLSDCRQEVYLQTEEAIEKELNKFIESEKKRSTTRRLFGLLNPPKARFSFDAASVKAYAETIDYPMFDSNPFHEIEQDRKNSIRWIEQLEKVAMCEQAGEPIQLDMETFIRISQPSRYYWARAGWTYSLPYC